MTAPFGERSAALVASGDELLRGAHPDLNGPFLARALAPLGVQVAEVRLVGDQPAELERTLRELLARHALVILSGGLGPTLDDCTRDAAAAVLGVGLEYHPSAWDAIVERFRRRGLEPAESNRRQAFVPAGSELLKNARGTAPGFLARDARGHLLAALPGPPRELAGMWEAELAPRLARALGGRERGRREFLLGGLPESTFADQCGEWMERDADPLLGVSAKEGLLVAHLSSADPARLEARAAAFRERFARWLLAEGHPSLESAVVMALSDRRQSLALAESVTGGLVAARLTDVPGASAVLLEGFVAYSPAAKTRSLGVPAALIEAEGVVSPAVAAAMARGALERTGATWAVSLTGYAGPGGGDALAPEGTVCFAIASRALAFTRRQVFPVGDRDRVRQFALHTALELVLRASDGRLGELPDLQPA
jgi:nicotinamide-nucleotide amidase